jgi:uncharacterized protein YdhG (YjbR/CyaY superfamily)
MTSQTQTVDSYISSFPAETQTILKKIRKIVKEVLPPEAEEKISYGIAGYKLKTPVVYFAGFKNHVSLYPIPTGDAAFQKKITPHIKGKGTMQFQLSEPIPYELIKEIVKFRLQENLSKPQKYK